MISKELFIKTMERLEAFDHNMDAVDEALHALSPDFCGFYIPEVFDMTIEVLEEVFDDNAGWLAYCVYELDYLEKYKPGMILNQYSNPVDLSTWDKVYDFLIESMEG